MDFTMVPRICPEIFRMGLEDLGNSQLLTLFTHTKIHKQT